MKNLTAILASITVASAGLAGAFKVGHSRGYQAGYSAAGAEQKAFAEDFSARMYESNEDSRADAAKASGNAHAFMDGFQYAVEQATDEMN